jgi:AcrR family transcriptional regulator
MSVPAGREPLSREVMAEHQRERILDAATGVFAKRGYQATTVDNIVAAAKVGVGGFYALFGGKEECFLAAYDRVFADARARIVAALPAGRPWPEQACAALRATLDFLAAEPLRARVVLIESQTAGPAGLARYEGSIDELVPLLRLGRKHSPVAEELPPTLEVAVVGGLLWFLQQRLALGELEGIERFLPDAAEIVIEPYLGRTSTERLLAATAG